MSDVIVNVTAAAPSVAVTEQTVVASVPASQPVAVSVAGVLPLPVTVTPPATLSVDVSGGPGPAGESWQETWETVSKNLRSYPATLAYAAGELSSITYATPAGAVVKTLTRTAGRLTAIVLSGAMPAGIATTKTLTYTGDDLTSVGYA